jgi:hypothetical protein
MRRLGWAGFPERVLRERESLSPGRAKQRGGGKPVACGCGKHGLICACGRRARPHSTLCVVCQRTDFRSPKEQALDRKRRVSKKRPTPPTARPWICRFCRYDNPAKGNGHCLRCQRSRVKGIPLPGRPEPRMKESVYRFGRPTQTGLRAKKVYSRFG